jgi:putative two-component system response regulator
MNNVHPKQTVLVVDDMQVNIIILTELLRSDYKVKAATNGVDAFTIAQSFPLPDLILLDIMMPELDGYDVINRLKSNPKTKDIPVIFVTALTQENEERLGFDLGAVDYITKPFSPTLVLSRVKTHLAMYNYNRRLEEEVAERTQALEHSQNEIINRLCRAAEYKNNECDLHLIRMSHYSSLIAQGAGLPIKWCENIKNATPMHDIGKLAFDNTLLLKADNLTHEEDKALREHTTIGAKIIGDHDSELLQIAKSIALTHHEKWDGSGYPAGLSKTNIPLEGRIVAIADMFESLTTASSSKEVWPVEEAVILIEAGANSHFDPDLIAVFLKVLPKIIAIKNKGHSI